MNLGLQSPLEGEWGHFQPHGERFNIRLNNYEGSIEKRDCMTLKMRFC
jgi:hypothetical protein